MAPWSAAAAVCRGRDFRLDVTKVHGYHAMMPASISFSQVERIQTGVRLERRLLKVLKGLAEYTDLSLGDLIEGIVLHAFDNKAPFNLRTLQKIADLKAIYELELDSSASHMLKEKS